MSFSNPTAATQGRGFDAETRPTPGRTTRRVRATLLTLALAAAPLLSTGCRSFQTVAEHGAAARMVAAVDARQVHAAEAYEAPPAGDDVLLAGVR